MALAERRGGDRVRRRRWRALRRRVVRCGSFRPMNGNMMSSRGTPALFMSSLVGGEMSGHVSTTRSAYGARKARCARYRRALCRDQRRRALMPRFVCRCSQIAYTDMSRARMAIMAVMGRASAPLFR